MKHLLASIFLFFHPAAPQPAMNMSQSCGDSRVHAIPLSWDDEPFAPGDDWSLMFTAKRQARDTDAQALIQKISGAGITVTGATAAVAIVPQDTAALAPGDIVWDVQALHLTTGDVHTVAEGRLSLKRDVSRLATPSIPIHTLVPPVLLGPPGKSPYQLAVDNGYSGTVQEWLATLPAHVTAQEIIDALGYVPSNAPLTAYTRSGDNGAPLDGVWTPQLVTGTLTNGTAAVTFPELQYVGEISINYSDTPIFEDVGGIYQLARLHDRWILWADGAPDAEWESTAVCDMPSQIPAGEWDETNPEAWKPKGSATGVPVVSSPLPVLTGTLGQEVIVGNQDVYRCTRAAPVKWVKLN